LKKLPIKKICTVFMHKREIKASGQNIKKPIVRISEHRVYQVTEAGGEAVGGHVPEGQQGQEDPRVADQVWHEQIDVVGLERVDQVRGGPLPRRHFGTSFEAERDRHQKPLGQIDSGETLGQFKHPLGANFSHRRENPFK
jgi:hypothetical protein